MKGGIFLHIFVIKFTLILTYKKILEHNAIWHVLIFYPALFDYN